MLTKIWLFFWWISNENEVSISSAENIIKYIDTSKYNLILVYWSLDGDFYKIENIQSILDLQENDKIRIEDFWNYFEKALLMTHWKYWEDWVLQGILESQKIPYCWSRVLSSALCMDKWLFKKFLQWQDINQTKFVSLDTKLSNTDEIYLTIETIKKTFKLPIYVKPCNSWSSIGISEVNNFDKIQEAIEIANIHDSKVIIEQWLESPQEIELAVLWNNNPLISLPGKLILAKEFYDYEDKYKLNQATVIIPAKLTKSQIQEIQSIASKVYKLCGCSGFARIDFFISDDKIYLNEINTLPWFTDISMFPMLMNHMWINFQDLISQIIELWY